MIIRIKTFASLKDAAGFSDREMDVCDGLSIREIVEQLKNSSDKFKSFSDPLLFAVNEEFRDSDHKLKQGDVLAIFPPVSGG